MPKAFSWSERSLLLGIFVLALVLRILLMLYLRSYIFPSYEDHWHYGYETGRIAASLASGHGFSSPFPNPSGPTAWLAPAYPFLLAGIFKIFGIYSTSSAVAVILLQSLFSALTCVVAYAITRHAVHSVSAAALVAVILAVYPTSIWFAINYIWDDSLLALCLAATFLLLLRVPENLAPKRALTLGLLMGFTILVSPVVLSFYLTALLFTVWRARTRRVQALRFVGVAGATIFLILLPWLIRNYLRFGKMGLIKAGFGVEFRIGNNPEATGMYTQAGGKRLHPSAVAEEFARYVQMGEINYSRYCYDQAMAFIAANPRRFLWLCLKRVGYFWIGDWEESQVWLGNFSRSIPLALFIKKLTYVVPLPFLCVGLFAAWRRGKDFALALAILLFITFPLVYYITHVLAKYRYYIDTLILVFASYGFCVMIERLAGSTKKEASPVTTLRKSG